MGHREGHRPRHNQSEHQPITQHAHSTRRQNKENKDFKDKKKAYGNEKYAVCAGDGKTLSQEDDQFHVITLRIIRIKQELCVAHSFLYRQYMSLKNEMMRSANLGNGWRCLIAN